MGAYKQWNTKRRLVADLRQLGLLPGDMVMVHASLRSVGPILGGPDVLIQAMLEATSPGGTIMAYTDWQDAVQELTRSDAEELVSQVDLEELPAFNPGSSRARRDYGVLPEFLRTFPGSVRSGNPGASICAVGSRARWLCENHPLQYGYGLGSPLAKLVETGGRILLLGSPLDSVTLLHYAEHMAAVPGKRVIHYREPILIDGEKKWVEIEEFDTSEPVITGAPDNYFEQIVRAYLAGGGGRSGFIGSAPSYLLEAAGLFRFSVEWIESRYR